MAASFPYTLYACPCNDTTSSVSHSTLTTTASHETSNNEEREERTFNPHSPRANYALNPLENLLFCDECNIIRCSRCWTEEIIYWYCPNCLFEVPSSGVKSDGNRCARHCYNCPICMSSLAITLLGGRSTDNAFLKPSDASSGSESYILLCPHCNWSSLEIGVRLNKPTKITEQLNKMVKERSVQASMEDEVDEEIQSRQHGHEISHDELFTRLSTFYKEQLSESSEHQNPFATSPYNSPSGLSRLMNLYGGLNYNSLKKSREKPQPMREALTLKEGLVTGTADSAAQGKDRLKRRTEDPTIAGDNANGGSMTIRTTEAQRLATPQNHQTRFREDLWPIATPLRTKRGKRCRSCRQFLARPEPKVGSMRYKIRLIAANHIQKLSIRPLLPAAASQPPLQISSSPSSSSSPNPRPESTFSLPTSMAGTPLISGQITHFVLTVRNPVFEPVRVTLATPVLTPGRIQSRVTILCPAFTVGAAGDVWDEALASGGAGNPPSTMVGETLEGGRRAAMASLTGSVEGMNITSSGSGVVGGGGERQPEAGKIWDKTKSSTSVVLEVVPGLLIEREREEVADDYNAERFGHGDRFRDWDGKSLGLEEEDHDVLEIPIFVRAEWEADPHADVSNNASSASAAAAAAAGGLEGKKGEKESRELAYWCVLALGRIKG